MRQPAAPKPKTQSEAKLPTSTGTEKSEDTNTEDTPNPDTPPEEEVKHAEALIPEAQATYPYQSQSWPEGVGKIYGQMACINTEITPITKSRMAGKDGDGSFKFSYRGIDDVYQALHVLFARHQVFLVPTTEDRWVEETETKGSKDRPPERRRLVGVTNEYRFVSGLDGSFVSAKVSGEGMDQSDKALPKAHSVALKYCLMQVFTIPTNDKKDVEADLETMDPDSIKFTVPREAFGKSVTNPWLNSGTKPYNDLLTMIADGQAKEAWTELKKWKLNGEAKDVFNEAFRNAPTASQLEAKKKQELEAQAAAQAAQQPARAATGLTIPKDPEKPTAEELAAMPFLSLVLKDKMLEAIAEGKGLKVIEHMRGYRINPSLRKELNAALEAKQLPKTQTMMYDILQPHEDIGEPQ
jgi:hypothetical protein